MASPSPRNRDLSDLVAGVDVGSECVKAVVLQGERRIVGRAVVPATGYFQQRIREALDSALDEAQIVSSALAGTCVTGFGARRSDLEGAFVAGDASCHARGAYFHFPEAMTVVDLGGRAPTVIQVDAEGRRTASRRVRRCAVGIGTFLMFTARHLDVHPTRLQELAGATERVVPISSYCSVFAESELLEQLRDGATREEVARGCMQSIAERVLELGHLEPPVVISGGVPEYFPGVSAALASHVSGPIRTVPEPIQTGALGAALTARLRRQTDGEPGKPETPETPD